MTDKNKLAIGAMAMDLKRVTMCYYNGSDKTAQRFCEEALKRCDEIDQSKLVPYLKRFINKLPKLLNKKDNLRVAEDALMLSTIFQNYITQK